MTNVDDNSNDVSDLRDFVALTDLRDVVFHAVSAERAPECSEDDFEMQVALRIDERELGVRCRAVATGGGGRYTVDSEAIFNLSSDVAVRQEILREFVQKIGVMVVYPYLRSAVTESAAKLALKKPVLKLLRAGNFEVTADGTEQE